MDELVRKSGERLVATFPVSLLASFIGTHWLALASMSARQLPEMMSAQK